MIYEHPLAYLLGIEGLALLRGFTGERDENSSRRPRGPLGLVRLEG